MVLLVEYYELKLHVLSIGRLAIHHVLYLCAAARDEGVTTSAAYLSSCTESRFGYLNLLGRGGFDWL